MHEQIEMRLMGRLDGASVAPSHIIKALPTASPGDPDSYRAGYRAACRLAWKLKRVKGATQASLAAEAGLYASHITDYLHEDDKPSRRDLPGHAVVKFNAFVGNTIVTQWLNAQDQLTVLEEMQAERAAA